VLGCSGRIATRPSQSGKEARAGQWFKGYKNKALPLVRKCKSRQGEFDGNSLDERTGGFELCVLQRTLRREALLRDVGGRAGRQMICKVAEDVGVNVGGRAFAFENAMGAAGVDAHVEGLA